MKILSFSAYYTPEIAASMYLTEDLYKGMVESGHTLEIYVPMPTRGVSDEIRREYKSKKFEQKYDKKLTIHRISMYREGKNVISRAFRYLFLNVIFLWKGLITDADVIFVQSTPPTQGMMAGIISSMKKIPLVYNLQDIFPDSLVNAGMTRKGSIVWKIGRLIEDYSYRHSKKIIVISDDFKKNIIAKGVSEEKIVVVPNWADVGGVHPVARENNVLINRYCLDPKKFYITYCGNVGLTQNMDLLLDVAKKLKYEILGLSFIIIGDGADKIRVQKRIADEKISNVIMLPFQPYEDIAHVFSLGDAGLIISKPGIGDNSVPSKMWNILAAGKPVLASFDSNSKLAQLINEIQCGVVVNSGDFNALYVAIKRMVNSNDYGYGRNGLKYISSYLNKDVCVKKYIETLSLR